MSVDGVPPPIFTSPVSHLLRSNDPPRDTFEETVIRSIVSEAGDKISHLDDEIDRLEADLELRRRQRQEVRAFVDDHNNVLSSFRRFPREIIAEIVLHALYRYTDHPIAVTLNVNSDPWRFGQICRTWRDVVLNLCALWSLLEIVLEGFAGAVYDPPHAEEITAVLLERSKRAPLSLIFKESCFGPSTSGVSQQILGMITRQSHRWKTAHFEINVVNLHCDS